MHPHRFVVCTNAECEYYGVWRQVFATKVSPGMYTWYPVVCQCRTDIELPVAVTGNGYTTAFGRAYPQQLPMDLDYAGAVVMEPPC